MIRLRDANSRQFIFRDFVQMACGTILTSF